MESFDVELTMTKTVEAENKDEAWEKVFEEFMQEGINPNCFYVYINGKGYC